MDADAPTDHRCDVLVAGAGLVGLAAAVALARGGLQVALVDRAPIEAPAHDPASWDSRVYAISPGSARFLDALGAWPPERLEAVEAMRVKGDSGSSLGFSAYELGERALAWIVEERALRAKLVSRLAPAGVHALPPAPLAGLAFGPSFATATLEGGTTIAARLVVGADGLRSWVRHAAGLAAEPRPYHQTAVVANFSCERPHRGIARQWFLPGEGILAWLPLPGPRISIVWSAPEALADELAALSPGAFAQRVADAGEGGLGRLELVTPPARFPLHFMRLPATVAHRLALVGDAAHGVHPLAGQGVNLGFGDAQALGEVMAGRGPLEDAGAPLLLERHARLRAEPVAAMQAVTDGLARLFGAQGRWVARLRNAGMAAVDRLPPLKRALAQPALR
ncbi:MAG TPA: FAD-dependent monooxygenase [Casimicrobiaceae bacterium]